jgi:hypothetical protein
MAHEAQPGLLARALAEQPGLGVGGLSQVEASRRFDRLLPVRYTMDGNTDFQENVLPSLNSAGHDHL